MVVIFFEVSPDAPSVSPSSLLSLQLQPFLTTCLDHVAYLLLGGNSLEYLPQDVFVHFRNLQSLLLTRNGLEVLDKYAFRGLHLLRTLDLSKNRLFSPNTLWFQDLEVLETLDLSDNNLHLLPSKVFRFLGNLKTLDLSSNQIQHVYPSGFQGLRSLTQLLMTSNHLTTVPFDTPRSFVQLDLIDLSNNHFKCLQAGAFRDLNVKRLKLNRNEELRIIDKGAFTHLPILEELEIQSNPGLRYVDRGAMVHLDALRVLRLSGNGLRTLDAGLLSDLDPGAVVGLGGNPWRCDCGLRWMGDGRDDNPAPDPDQSPVGVVVLDANQALCAEPSTKRGCRIPALEPRCDNASVSTVSPDSASTPEPRGERFILSPNPLYKCAPSIVAFYPSSIETYIGEELKLDCRAHGEPEPGLEWVVTRNKGRHTYHVLQPGQSLASDHRVSVLETGTLHIEYVNHYDIGNYTCRARNPQGESAFTGALSIKNVLSHIIVVRVTDTSVTVTWKTDIHVHGYQILYRLRAPNTTSYHKVDILPYMKYYTVSGLSPHTGYEFCIAVKHAQKSLLISCNSTGTMQKGFSQTAVHDATGFIIGGTTVCLLGFVVLMCLGSQAVRMYNRKQQQQRRFLPAEGAGFGDDSDVFLAGLDSLSETSPMTYENRFALMFDDSDIEEIQSSAAEAGAALGLRTDTDL